MKKNTEALKTFLEKGLMEKQKSSKTRPIGPKTKNLTVNVPEELHAELTRLSKDSGLNLSEFLRPILMEAAKKKMRVSIQVNLEEGGANSKLDHVREILPSALSSKQKPKNPQQP